MSITVKSITPPDLVPLKRALLSVSDKTGLVDFARRPGTFGLRLDGRHWRG